MNATQRNIHHVSFRVDTLTQDAFREAMQRDGAPTITEWVRRTSELACSGIIERLKKERMASGHIERPTNADAIIAWRKRGYSRQAIAAKTGVRYRVIDETLKEAGL